MDLIYATPDKEDIGILNDYELDLAYGDENNFSLKLNLNKHCCGDDYVIYMVDTQNGFEDATEYGGIIDAVAVDTAQKSVTYTGRTWHGILAGKIIEPEPGQDYKVVTGDAHEIIAELIEDAGLSDLFVCEGTSEISIGEYQFYRYTDLYSGICKMLADSNGKLILRYQNKKVVMSAVWIVDYSQDDEWDSSQVNFMIQKVTNPVNHLVCLGQGDLKNRNVIHLFADENGGIEPYAFTDSPLKDEDYILDKRNQVLFGDDEVAKTFDYSSAAITDNYVLVDIQPDDWKHHYEDYYIMGDSGFEPVSGTQQDDYTLLTEQPPNWATRYSNYSTANGMAVEGIENERYVKVTVKPSDWEKNWANYYTYFWDGVRGEYQAVGSVTKMRYEKQTKKPTDWNTNFGSYFKRAAIYKETKKNGKVVKREKVGVGYVHVTAVKKGKKQVAPTWAKGKYFTGYSYGVAPNFATGGTKYRREVSTVAPTWQSGKYYAVETVTIAPTWQTGSYYRLYHDHYADLVMYGIEQLTAENTNCDSITINLSLLGEYDVGDIVGATEAATGVSVWQPITKKIIKVSNGKESITYQIGEHI